ncbi:MAG: integrase [Chlamydiae bacterium CG10_big_fil_rev_8_21_14_0_10_35_9]|nr:MAG: integrase [Chlamydiae bacterium CG10_big_fil_rev_8_21_14_0_10_35_9]
MATIKERKTKEGKPKYQVRIRRKGYPVQVATFARLTEAKRWARQTEVAIEEGRHFKISAAKKHTLADMIDRYIKQFQPPQAKKSHLYWWKNRIGCYLLADITPALIAEGRDELLITLTNKSKQRSPSTVVRYIASLSHVFTIGIKEYGWLQTSPIANISKPKEPPGRVRFLSDEERKRLLIACQKSDSPYLYLVVILAISTGMRKSEIMTLTWPQVDLFKKQIILEKTKNKSHRVIPLARLPLELLKQHLQQKKVTTNLLFPGKHLSRSIDLRKPWLKALNAAGVQNFKFHDLRHTAASYMAMSGSSLTEIGILLGHKRLDVTKRYTHLTEKHLSKAVEKMNEVIFG